MTAPLAAVNGPTERKLLPLVIVILVFIVFANVSPVNGDICATPTAPLAIIDRVTVTLVRMFPSTVVKDIFYPCSSAGVGTLPSSIHFK
jgi:F0F1-type ATP synthase membrane subunit a